MGSGLVHVQNAPTRNREATVRLSSTIEMERMRQLLMEFKNVAQPRREEGAAQPPIGPFLPVVARTRSVNS